MNVLLLAPHPFFRPRGTPLAERQLLRVLSRLGHRVTVLTVHQGEHLELPGVRIARLPRLPGMGEMPPGFSLQKLICDLMLLVACWRELGRERYDLVHASEEAAFIALVVGRLRARPYVYDMDSSLPEQLLARFPWLRPLGGALRRCEGAAVRGSVGVLAVCRELERVARRHGPPTLAVRTVEDASLLDEPADPTTLARAADEMGSIRGPRVLYVGNLERYQGIDLLLEAFARIAVRDPAPSLVLVGGAPHHIAHYRRRAEALGLHGRVQLLGPRPVGALGGYLRGADVLVSPRIEGHNTPMKVYSYLASGRPVVATRLPTHTQVLDDRVARLAEPNAEALATALADLLADGDERRRLAANAATLARAEYSPAAHDARLAAFYAAVERRLARARPGTARRTQQVTG